MKNTICLPRYAALVITGLLIFGISQAMAINEIIFDPSTNFYSPGDLVELKGKVAGSPNKLVAVEVKDPDGRSILVRTVQTDAGGNFVLKFKVPSSIKSGKLDIIANTKVNGVAVSQVKEISDALSVEKSTPNADGNIRATLLGIGLFFALPALVIVKFRHRLGGQFLRKRASSNTSN